MCKQPTPVVEVVLAKAIVQRFDASRLIAAQIPIGAPESLFRVRMVVFVARYSGVGAIATEA